MGLHCFQLNIFNTISNILFGFHTQNSFVPLQQDSEKKGSNREWQGACDLNSPQVSPKPPFLPLWLPIAEWWISWGVGVWGDILWDGAPPPDARCRLKAISTSLSHSLSLSTLPHSPLHNTYNKFTIIKGLQQQ